MFLEMKTRDNRDSGELNLSPKTRVIKCLLISGSKSLDMEKFASK